MFKCQQVFWNIAKVRRELTESKRLWQKKTVLRKVKIAAFCLMEHIFRTDVVKSSFVQKYMTPVKTGPDAPVR